MCIPWEQQLSGAVTDLKTLCRVLALDLKEVQALPRVVHDFSLRVPYPFLSRIEKGNLKDPLLLQILPTAAENQYTEVSSLDPLDEANAQPVLGLLHKYFGRVLLVFTGACAVNCRYCFRRHYPYSKKVPGLLQWQPALDYIASHETIEEVILSGGDPLLMKDSLLIRFIKKLENISNLKRLRIHTRLPIVIPSRITNDLLAGLTASRLKVILVLHTNHANELDHTVCEALLKCQGITLLNQSVLLRGVNDVSATLVELSKRLFEMNVLPYYLHLLDPVQGAMHFDVDEKTALRLMKEVSEKLPGYLVPKLAKEVPHQKSKIFIA